jgi:predicted phage-related endonuclease
MSLEDKVDLGARLRAVVKNCSTIDEIIKSEIKKKLRDKAGTILGDLFKANLVLVPTTRFDSKVFKEAHPDLYEKYSTTDDQKRVLFEPR